MVDFLAGIFGNVFGTVVMSLIPLIELKGGIVFARGAGLSFFEALGLSYLGSTLVFIPIFFLFIPILNLLKKIKWFNKFALKIESYFKDKADDTLEKNEGKKSGKKLSEKSKKILSVFLFVAIPLPMTGVWTGTAIAVFLGLKMREAILPVALGNLVAGIIISVLAELLKGYLDYVLYGLFALAIILLIITIIKISRKKTY